MTTYIIGADGTRYVKETQVKRRRAKITAIVALLASTPFMVAAAMGLGMAARGETPSDLPTPLPAAVKACDKVIDQYQGYCIGLYLRPAYEIDLGEGAMSYTPAGPALVKECTDQYTDRDELGMCLTQGIAGDNR